MDHKEMNVWKEAISLVTVVYQLTENFPAEELYGLTNQIRRCAISIPSNIAEGCARFSSKDTLKFLYISMGSLAELETQFIIAQNINYIGDIEMIIQKIEVVRKLIYGVIKHLKQ